MILLVISFIAGVLTIMAPCILPVLPIVLGRSLNNSSRYRPYVISLSLVGSIVVFTLILKVSTAFVAIPTSVWAMISGSIIVFFGIITILPNIWSRFSRKTSFQDTSNSFLGQATQKAGYKGDILIGLALGPVFSSCSPTYFLILASILPQSFFVGLIYLIAYALGLGLMLLLISLLGQRFVSKIGFMANPRGWFKKILGLIFIILGIAMMLGLDKKAEAYLIDKGYADVTGIEQKLLNLSGEGSDDENLLEDMLLQRKFSNFKTDLEKSSISFSDILDGGPGKDGIPPLFEPKFTNIENASLDDEVLGIMVKIDGERRFYPYNILVWHEIVNDTIGDTDFAVTFCPLCGSAITYDRKIGDKILKFGVSGFLYESNLLMYDHETESLWSQSLGEAVVGEMLGQKLELIPMQVLTFAEVKANERYSQIKILSDDTGYDRNYEYYPYGDYNENDRLYFPVSVSNKQFSPKEIMYVFPVGNTSFSIQKDIIVEGEDREYTINNHNIVIKKEDGEIDVYVDKKRVPGYYEMWFSWAVHHQGDGAVLE